MKIKIDTGYETSTRILNLCGALRDPDAGIYPLRLWLWAAARRSGDLQGLTCKAIEIIVGARDIDGRVFNALHEFGFIECDDGVRPLRVVPCPDVVEWEPKSRRAKSVELAIGGEISLGGTEIPEAKETPSGVEPIANGARSPSDVGNDEIEDGLDDISFGPSPSEPSKPPVPETAKVAAEASKQSDLSPPAHAFSEPMSSVTGKVTGGGRLVPPPLDPLSSPTISIAINKAISDPDPDPDLTRARAICVAPSTADECGKNVCGKTPHAGLVLEPCGNLPHEEPAPKKKSSRRMPAEGEPEPLSPKWIGYALGLAVKQLRNDEHYAPGDQWWVKNCETFLKGFKEKDDALEKEFVKRIGKFVGQQKFFPWNVDLFLKNWNYLGKTQPGTQFGYHTGTSREELEKYPIGVVPWDFDPNAAPKKDE